MNHERHSTLSVKRHRVYQIETFDWNCSRVSIERYITDSLSVFKPIVSYHPAFSILQHEKSYDLRFGGLWRISHGQRSRDRSHSGYESVGTFRCRCHRPSKARLPH